MTKLNRSIDRGMSVLEVLHASGKVSLGVLAARTGLPKPTVLRICATLEARRWLFRRSSGGSYELGSAFPQGAGMPNLVDRLVAVGKQELLRLSAATGLASDPAAAIGGGRVLQEIAERLPREEVKALPQLPRIQKDIAARGYALRSPGHWGRAVDYGALPSAIALPIRAGDAPIGAINLIWNASDHRVEAVAADHLAQLHAAAQSIGRACAEQVAPTS